MGLPFGFENISNSSYIDHLKLDNLKGRDIDGYNSIMNYLAERYTNEANDLYLWDKDKADLSKLHSILVSSKFEVELVKDGFSWENFKPHFLPVYGQALIPIPWENRLNLLADLLKGLKELGAITIAQKVHMQAQKHFLFKGKKLDTGSFANLYKKPISKKNNAIILEIIALISK